MSDDLVKRLRGRQKLITASAEMSPDTLTHLTCDTLCGEAADLIEHLREEVLIVRAITVDRVEKALDSYVAKKRGKDAGQA